MSTDVEKAMVDTWIENQATLPVHEENIKKASTIVEKVTDENAPEDHGLNHAIGLYGDKLVALSSIGFKKPGGGVRSTVSMLDAAVNDQPDLKMSVDKGIEKLIMSIEKTPMHLFAGAPMSLRNDIRNKNWGSIESLIKDSVSMENDGLALNSDRIHALTNVLLPVAKYNTGQKIMDSTKPKLDSRIENAGYL